jgi:hypothetical protein
MVPNRHDALAFEHRTDRVDKCRPGKRRTRLFFIKDKHLSLRIRSDNAVKLAIDRLCARLCGNPSARFYIWIMQPMKL